MEFGQIIGNEENVNRLKVSAKNNNPFHAYIFEGQDGVGKRLTAFTFAKAIYCLNPKDGEPCGICNNCRKLESGNLSDFHYITSDGSSVKDKQIEEMQELATKKPFDTGRNIFIIDKADTMTPRAQNRLLKTLEEPPQSLILILLSENIGAIVQTVISRCVLLKFKPIEKKKISIYLQDKYSLSAEDASVAAAFSYGSVGRAEYLLTSDNFRERRESSISVAEELWQGMGSIDFSKTIKEYMGNKEDASEYLDLLEFWYRDALLISSGADSELLLNMDKMSRLKKMASEKPSEIKLLCKIIEVIEQAKNDIKMNISINYTLKNMLLSIH